VVTGQFDTCCCTVHIVLCFILVTKYAVGHRMLKIRQEIPDFSVAKDVHRVTVWQKRMYWGK
jgi:hypothetical protein